MQAHGSLATRIEAAANRARSLIFKLAAAMISIKRLKRDSLHFMLRAFVKGKAVKGAWR